MARMRLTTGLCPICGDTVARTVSTHHGIASEAYHCPEHGRREASPTGWTVQEWGGPGSGWGSWQSPSMPHLAEMLAVEHTAPSWAMGTFVKA